MRDVDGYKRTSRTHTHGKITVMYDGEKKKSSYYSANVNLYSNFWTVDRTRENKRSHKEDHAMQHFNF